MWIKKNRQQLETRTEPGSPTQGQLIWRRLTRQPLARWSLRLLYLLVFIALFADFLANEKPLFCRVDGQTYFPVCKQYTVDLGWSEWPSGLAQADWRALPYEQVVFPPIPYSPETLDRRNMNYRGPFEAQRIPSWRFRHWLGTDQIGRDVAAGMIRGTRVALLVGIIAMSIATLVGVFFGALAGYFGDDNLYVSRAGLWLGLTGLALGLFYGFVVRSYAIREGPPSWELVKSLGILLGFLGLAYLLSRPLKRLPGLGKRMAVPADLLVMRLIEIINSIPTLLLILAVVAIIRQPSILHVMVIIGLISWTGIARFVRAELLRIRGQEYIEAARAMGFSDRRILLRHALPNALTPVLITVAFGIAGAVLLEAFLSFLGIGLAAEEVTWGALLKLARYQVDAWWLAVFPGLAIFVTVTLFNLLGESLTEAIDPKGG